MLVGLTLTVAFLQDPPFETSIGNGGNVPDRAFETDRQSCPLSGNRQTTRHVRDWGALLSGSFRQE